MQDFGEGRAGEEPEGTEEMNHDISGISTAIAKGPEVEACLA